MLTLRISPRWITELKLELADAGSREIGGILMAEQLEPGEFAVAEMTFQRRGGMLASFVRNARQAWCALRLFFKRTDHCYTRFNYIGEWHSHPSFSVQPSDRDHASMMDLINDPDVGADFLLLLVVRLDCDETLAMSLTGYRPQRHPQVASLILDDGVNSGSRPSYR